MTIRWDIREHVTLGIFVFKWLAICVPSGAVVGSAVALFLWSLDRVTEIHWANPWLLYLLPVAGLISGYLYHRFGQTAEAGNNLIMEQIHEPGGGVPTRMAPGHSSRIFLAVPQVVKEQPCRWGAALSRHWVAG